MTSSTRHGRLTLYFCVAIVISAIATILAANPDQVEQLRNTNKCPLCDLSEAKLSGWQLEGADLSGANLFSAQLYMSILRGANLAGAILQGANLKAADLNGATDAELSGAETDERTICPNGNHGPCQ